MPFRDTPLPSTYRIWLGCQSKPLIRLLTLHRDVTDFRLQCKVTTKDSPCQVFEL